MDNTQDISVAEEMSKSFLDYSMSVIISRALPDIRDGLKPSQRRILYAMREINLLPNKSHIKCAKICGDTSGNYHPHGEAVIYPTLVHMAQPWAMREILVDGQGNFGSIEGDPPAAMRYTEARLTHLGLSLMQDLDKETVDFVPNYDERLEEPVVLPAGIPNLLVNGCTGIAVGMATSIPPHNLGEVIDAICAQIDTPDISISNLMHYIKGPDFPNACDILGTAGIESYFKTGRGSFGLRGKAEIIETEQNRTQIVITEIPFGVNRALLQERIAELVRDKVITDISGLRDLSDENTHIEVELKRGANAQVVLNQLYKHTRLQTSFSVNMLAIHERQPKCLSLKEVIDCFIEHRREVILRRSRFLLRKAEERASVLEAFLLACANLDDFIAMIRNSKNREEARLKLSQVAMLEKDVDALGILSRNQESFRDGKYYLTKSQVNSILELRLYQLTALERSKVQKDYAEVIEKIKDLGDVLEREQRVLEIIKEELAEIKQKFNTPRNANIVPAEGDILIEDLIPNESMVVTLSRNGYIKRTSTEEYRVQARGGKGVRGMEVRSTQQGNEDFVKNLFTASSHDYLLFFTNTGRIYVQRVYHIPESSRSAKGRSIQNVLSLQEGETIASVLRVEQQLNEKKNDITFENEDYYVFFFTENGKVKKTALKDFRNYREGGIIAIRLEKGNELIDTCLTNGKDEIILATRNGFGLRFEEKQVRKTARNTQGVCGVRLRDKDKLIGATLVNNLESLLIVTENGLGKKTKFDAYRAQRRGGKGVKAIKCTEKTGLVVGALSVNLEDELMLITSQGQSIRIRTDNIRLTGRSTQGVKLLSIDKGAKLQDVAKIVTDDSEEKEEESFIENEEKNGE